MRHPTTVLSLRVSTYGVCGVGHGVEWADSHRVFVHDEEVSVVLLLDQLAEQLLLGCAKIIFVADFDSSLTKHLDALLECQAQGRAVVLKILEGVLGTDSFQLLLAALVQLIEDENEQVREHIEDLKQGTALVQELAILSGPSLPHSNVH